MYLNMLDVKNGRVILRSKTTDSVVRSLPDKKVEVRENKEGEFELYENGVRIYTFETLEKADREFAKYKKANDKNPDGTISPDEDRRTKELVSRASRVKQELKDEAYEIGGSFRGPGIWAQVRRTLTQDGVTNDIGKNNDTPDDQFDPKELEMGVEIEMEHTDDKEEALSIAKDHLNEIPDYYSRLKKMEADAKQMRDAESSAKQLWDSLSAKERQIKFRMGNNLAIYSKYDELADSEKRMVENAYRIISGVKDADTKAKEERLKQLKVNMETARRQGDQEEVKDLKKEIEELEKETSDGATIFKQGNIIVTEEKDSDGTYYHVVNTKTGEMIGDFDNESQAKAAAKSER